MQVENNNLKPYLFLHFINKFLPLSYCSIIHPFTQSVVQIELKSVGFFHKPFLEFSVFKSQYWS